MKMFKKFTALLIAVIFVVGVFVPTVLASDASSIDEIMLQTPKTDGKFFQEDSAAIYAYYSSVTANTWSSCNTVASKYKAVVLDCSDDYDNSGISNYEEITKAEILTEISMTDYAVYCEDIVEPTCYFVRVDAVTKAANDFNWNGRNYHVIICGYEGNSRRIFDIRLPLPITVNQNEPRISEANDYLDKRFSESKADTKEYNQGDTPRTYSGYKPLTIKVKRLRYNGRIDTVSFKLYVKCVVCAEICPTCSDNYSAAEFEWCKANAIVCRNYGWYRYLSAGVNSTYHITDSGSHDQVYFPEKHGNPDVGGHALANIVTNAVDTTWQIQLSNDELKIFLPRYANGAYNANGQHGGQFKQQGALYLAEQRGMNYREILHYYYDYAPALSTNPTYVVGNGGKIFVNESGDVNLDEILNTADVTMILSHAAGSITLDGLQFKLADYTNDKIVNTGDATALLAVISGN